MAKDVNAVAWGLFELELVERIELKSRWEVNDKRSGGREDSEEDCSETEIGGGRVEYGGGGGRCELRISGRSVVGREGSITLVKLVFKLCETEVGVEVNRLASILSLLLLLLLLWLMLDWIALASRERVVWSELTRVVSTSLLWLEVVTFGSVWFDVEDERIPLITSHRSE